MAQDPFRADQIKIEGDSEVALGERILYDDPLDGSLRFRDPRIVGGINLTALAGLQQLDRVLVVSPDGIGASKNPEGAPITTIQEALDLVPTSSDPLSPWSILVGPGVYIEDIQWSKDYVTLVGLGAVTLRNASAQSTIRVLNGVGSTPQKVTLCGVTIENNEPNQACVDIITSIYATGTLTVVSNPNVGDAVTVSGVVLTAIANGSVPAPGEFELGLTEDETADNLVTTISDPVNALTTVVVATATLNVVTIRAYNPGVGGNAITLASAVPLVITPSGATLASGADESTGSNVGLDRITIEGCRLLATATPSYPVRAKAINYLHILRTDVSGSSLGSILDIRECAYVRLWEVDGLKRLEMHYDSTAAYIPVVVTSDYLLQDVRASGVFNTDLTGEGSLRVLNSTLGVTALSGDRSWTFNHTDIVALQVGIPSPTVTMDRCSRGPLTGFGVGTLAETSTGGVVSFVLSALESVAFAVPQPDTNYQVVLESEVLAASVAVQNKTVNGFDVVFSAPQTTDVRYIVYRLP